MKQARTIYQERGRTMVEILFALVIIGILSVVSVYMYLYLMGKHRENETLRVIDLVVVGTYTSEKKQEMFDESGERLLVNHISSGIASIDEYTLDTPLKTHVSSYQIGTGVYEVVLNNVSYGVCQQVLTDTADYVSAYKDHASGKGVYVGDTEEDKETFCAQVDEFKREVPYLDVPEMNENANMILCYSLNGEGCDIPYVPPPPPTDNPCGEVNHGEKYRDCGLCENGRFIMGDSIGEPCYTCGPETAYFKQRRTEGFVCQDSCHVCDGSGNCVLRDADKTEACGDVCCPEGKCNRSYTGCQIECAGGCNACQRCNTDTGTCEMNVSMNDEIIDDCKVCQDGNLVPVTDGENKQEDGKCCVGGELKYDTLCGCPVDIFGKTGALKGEVCCLDGKAWNARHEKYMDVNDACTDCPSDKNGYPGTLMGNGTCCRYNLAWNEESRLYSEVDIDACGCPYEGELIGNVCCSDNYAWNGRSYFEVNAVCGCPEGGEPMNGVCCLDYLAWDAERQYYALDNPDACDGCPTRYGRTGTPKNGACCYRTWGWDPDYEDYVTVNTACGCPSGGEPMNGVCCKDGKSWNEKKNSYADENDACGGCPSGGAPTKAGICCAGGYSWDKVRGAYVGQRDVCGDCPYDVVPNENGVCCDELNFTWDMEEWAYSRVDMDGCGCPGEGELKGGGICCDKDNFAWDGKNYFNIDISTCGCPYGGELKEGNICCLDGFAWNDEDGYSDTNAVCENSACPEGGRLTSDGVCCKGYYRWNGSGYNYLTYRECGCETNDDCAGIDVCPGGNCFCDFSKDGISCTSGPEYRGRCSPVELSELPSEASAKGYVGSATQLDWFSAQNFCAAVNKTMVSYHNFNIYIDAGTECKKYSGVRCDNSDDPYAFWNALRDKFGRDRLVWTSDLEEGAPCKGSVVILTNGTYGITLNERWRGEDVLCH